MIGCLLVVSILVLIVLAARWDLRQVGGDPMSHLQAYRDEQDLRISTLGWLAFLAMCWAGGLWFAWRRMWLVPVLIAFALGVFGAMTWYSTYQREHGVDLVTWLCPIEEPEGQWQGVIVDDACVTAAAPGDIVLVDDASGAEFEPQGREAERIQFSLPTGTFDLEVRVNNAENAVMVVGATYVPETLGEPTIGEAYLRLSQPMKTSIRIEADRGEYHLFFHTSSIPLNPDASITLHAHQCLGEPSTLEPCEPFPDGDVELLDLDVMYADTSTMPPRVPALRQDGARYEITNLEDRTYLLGMDADRRGCTTVDVVAILAADGPQAMEESILGEAQGWAVPLSKFTVDAETPDRHYNVYISTSDCQERQERPYPARSGRSFLLKAHY